MKKDFDLKVYTVMDFAAFDLNLMRVLDAVLRDGSTVKAAERLGISQPAVSAALARLRHALDDELFIRQGSRLIPTRRADRLALPLREELLRLEALLSDDGAFDPARAQLTFRIAGADFFAELLMAELTTVIAREAPGIRLQLVDLVRDVYVESLEQFKADIALHPEQSVPDWVERRTLMQLSYVMIAARGQPALKAAGLTPGDVVPIDLFCSLGHVLFSPEGNMAAVGDAALARVGRERRVVLTLPFFSSIFRLVSQTDLVALMPAQLAEHLAPHVDFAMYQPPVTVTSPLLVATWHRRNDRNAAHAWLRAQIFRILAPYRTAGLPD